MMTVIVKGSGMNLNSREKMIVAAQELLSEHGYAGMSFGDVIERSGAPRGSIYHHFPGGKQQLVTEAVQRYAATVLANIAKADEAGSSVDTVRVFVDLVRRGLRASDFCQGCAVAAVVLDATAADGELLALTSNVFNSWRVKLASAFRRDGATEAGARRLATFVVASVEGAMMLARAERDIAPIADVGHELEAHVHAALG
jgi:TetR/AcrR family transcriptional regulator, lmrAB and yxaGH operons repressor